MSRIVLHDFCLSYPIYQGSAKFLRQTLVEGVVGGAIKYSKNTNLIRIDALKNLNLQISSGDRVALVGHNGAGKSSLLRAIAGIYYPVSGTIECEGKIASLFDISFGVDEEATGYENILLRGLMMGLTKEEIKTKQEEICLFSGLGQFLDLPTKTYSSGMSLRLLFSISTSIDADIILMDEWIAAGDQEFVEKANKRLMDLVDKSKILVIASHNIDLLKSICNRVIKLKSGEVVFDGLICEAIEKAII